MSNTLRTLSVPLFLYAALAGLWAPGAGAQPTVSQASHPFAASRPIAGRYIVTFDPAVANPAAEAANLMRGVGTGGQLHHVYTAAIRGFAATLPDRALAGLRNNPNVQAIEQDQTVSLVQVEINATWGLDRIDQVDRPLDLTYHYNGTGTGVTAFIIDTGIRADHVEFTGRLQSGYSAISDGNGTSDCNGHGTHVAGTVGGTTWGVAKQVALTPVRVLNCQGSGTWSGVIAGVDWVANSTARPAVANMSLGGGLSSAVNAAVAGAVNKGVTMVVAAGNSSANACNYSPASEPSALTVGATTSGDARASYSNYGSCLDVFAPGSTITSAWHTASNATNTISGTSMASPHVAGVAALVSAANRNASPAAVSSFMVQNASANKLSSIGTGSPNLLLFSLASGSATEPAVIPVAIGSMTVTSSKSGGRNWRAKVTTPVFNTSSTAPVANATVTGTFTPGGSASCVTDTSGKCTLTSAPISTSVGQTSFSVTGVTGANMSYSTSSTPTVSITKP